MGLYRGWVMATPKNKKEVSSKPEVGMLALRRELADTRAALDKAEFELDSREVLVKTLQHTIERVGPAPLKVNPDFGKGRKPITCVLSIGDWHVGANQKASEVEGLNKYNWKICQSRVGTIVKVLLEWVECQRKSYAIEECYVLGLGDLINGLIHEELNIYNEFEPPVQAVKAGHLLTSLCKELASYFKKVSVYSLATDNHSRITKKPFAAGRGLWSFGYIVNEIAKIALEATPNVDVHNIESIKRVVDIAGWKWLIQHGNDIKSAGFWGITNAMERRRAVEAIIRMNNPHIAFDYMMQAHYHIPYEIGNILGNGSLIGTTTYDHANGRFARPCQMAGLVHPDHGLFNKITIWPAGSPRGTLYTD